MELTEQFQLCGDELTFEVADRIVRAGERLIEQASEDVIVDLARLKNSNSLAVALLSSWYRHANLHKKSIVFVNLSGELRNIIAFSGLTDILLPAD